VNLVGDDFVAFLRADSQLARADLEIGGAIERMFGVNDFGRHSLSSSTYSGPEMPPSLRMRQKCRIISTEAMIGMKMQ
jgi:hypothetical protein